MYMLLRLLAVSAVSPGNLPHIVNPGSGTISTVLGIVFGLAGGLALLMITISGLRYVLSAGDPEKVAKAKSGIIYALVGLAIALAAESIVGYVGSRV